MSIEDLIESYEPYHIGSKIASIVNIRSLATKIFEYFEQMDSDEYEINYEIFGRESILNPIINILTKIKEKTSVQLNLPVAALNVVGNKPSHVYELSKELVEILPDLGFELDSTFLFYEIITNIHFKVNKEPINLFKKFSCDKFSEIEGMPEMHVNYIKFSDVFVPKEDDERFQIEFVPNPTSPSKRIILKMLWRFKNYSDLENFHKDLNELIENIFNKLIED